MPWQVLMWVAIFIAALAFLIKSSDYFIGAAEKIGLSLGMPPIIIGTLILAFGTSLPELVTSIISIYSDNSEIVTGNVIGSNIANMALVMGVMAIVAGKVVLNPNSVWIDIAFVGIATMFAQLFLADSALVYAELGVLLVIYVAYLVYSFKGDTGGSPLQQELEEIDEKNRTGREKVKWYTWLVLAGGGVGIYFGAEFTVRAIIEISTILNLGKEVVALSAVALGTSLPELVVSVVSIRKGKTELAVGNILGSNIFNILLVLGLPGLLSLLSGKGSIIVPDAVVNLSVPLMVFLTVALFLLLVNRRVRWYHGILFLLVYVGFYVELYSGIISKLIPA